MLFTTPGVETNIFLAYEDSQCDSNQNHIAGQSGFENLDGDGIQAASGRDGICGTADDNPSFFGADGLCGYNPSTQAIDDTGDNCALVYNPLQNDADGDKVGGNVGGGVYLGCDNCPFLYNPSQDDGDLDGVGDACDNDDVDGDGVNNSTDNCPDVANPSQDVGAGGRGDACDDATDLDGDTVPDVSDNCVSTSNLNQADTDAATTTGAVPLGDACDGDCVGTCAGGARAGLQCFVNPDCPSSTCTGRVCSGQDDDADLDLVTDSIDNCAVTSNPTILPGSDPPLQSDDNVNTIGNACDPAGSVDENRDGLPGRRGRRTLLRHGGHLQAVPLANLIVAPAHRPRPGRAQHLPRRPDGSGLPQRSQRRKGVPLYAGLLAYRNNPLSRRPRACERLR